MKVIYVVTYHFLTLHVEMAFHQRGFFLPYKIERDLSFLLWQIIITLLSFNRYLFQLLADICVVRIRRLRRKKLTSSLFDAGAGAFTFPFG